MPYFILNRNYPLQGFGHSINFKKDEETWVPQLLVNDAVAIGAVPADGQPIDVLGPETPPPVPLTADEREALLMAAFDDLMARAGDPVYREDFNAQGLPNLKALEKIVGFEPASKERKELWQKYREAKAQ